MGSDPRNQTRKGGKQMKGESASRSPLWVTAPRSSWGPPGALLLYPRVVPPPPSPHHVRLTSGASLDSQGLQPARCPGKDGPVAERALWQKEPGALGPASSEFWEPPPRWQVTPEPAEGPPQGPSSGDFCRLCWIPKRSARIPEGSCVCQRDSQIFFIFCSD